MNAVRTLFALSVAALATACAAPGPGDPHAGHAMAAAPAGMEQRMATMRDMHEKMLNAKTPEERQALMADHMKAMKEGMGMMREMSGMRGMGGMGEGKEMPKEMSKDMPMHQRSMSERMDMMQMMMEMMMDRMPPAPAAK
jgi:hypothetical protein